MELFPFSYSEYLKYFDQKESPESFHDYLLNGGFPEYLITGLDVVLQNLLLDIIARDFLFRHSIKNSRIITEIAVYLLGNISREFTLTRLQKTFT